ncbi:MAG TPA: hypothetical protein PKL78_06545 [Anaerolineales bacterium]|nr:hypothetical protein [Anaerolineales bacterium]HNN13199.1 hypothetical protein [Anaerolineales bacterium]HNO31317.1 hypothetical protein [Anaerolineales bacterium]
MTESYSPLKKYLLEQPKTTLRIMLTFEKVESILGHPLPPSAYHYRSWWSNERDGHHSHALAWLNAGWQIQSFNQKQKWVIFHRV